jgi:nucleotide-binding universal stress UspA family protein
MLPFRRFAVVVFPPSAAVELLDYADLLTRRWSPSAVRLLVPDGDRGVPPGADAERVRAQLPPGLAAAHDEGQATIADLRGAALDGVLRETVAMHADLLLVGAAAAGTDRRVLVRRLAMQAPCSLWMVPAGTTAAIRRILVPIDFSPRATDALQVATAIAAETGARCAALHVRFDPTLATPEEAVAAMLGREHEAFALLAARADLHGVEVEGLFEEGRDVAKVVLRVAEAEQADLVVMGTRGRTRAAALLLGSETEHILQESGRPVLAVKHFGAHLRLTEALVDPRVRDREGPRFG